jgi:hypothetical protein
VGAPHGITDDGAAHKDFIRPIMLRVDGMALFLLLLRADGAITTSSVKR